MKSLIAGVLLALMACSACDDKHRSIRTYALNSKAERTVCKGWESREFEGTQYTFFNQTYTEGGGSSGPWFATRCREYTTINERTLVGYDSNSNLYKCKVSREFYDHYAEGGIYSIPTNQCWLVSPEGF